MNYKKTNIFYIVSILLLVIALSFEVLFGLKTKSTKVLAYEKSGSIHYQTYLKKNNLLPSDVLDEQTAAISNLIDSFKVNYNYLYTLSDNIDYSLTYDVVATLKVFDSDNDSKPIFTESYTLIDETKLTGTGKAINIDLYNKEIEYSTYNRKVQSLKSEISPKANLLVTFNVKLYGYSNLLEREVTDTYSNTLTIPLSEKTITPSASNNLSEKIKGSFESTSKINQIIKLTMVITIAFIVLFIVLIIINTAKNKKVSKFDLKVRKILREFDRAITEVSGKVNLTDFDNKIKVTDFMELLDVHDNLNAPIMFFRNSNDKVTFAVKDNDDIYYTELKREDYDE